MEVIDLKGTSIVYTLSKASNMIVFPHFATISVLLCCPLVAMICSHSITRFIKGSNSCSILWRCLPPFNVNDKVLSIIFFLTWEGGLCSCCLLGKLKDAFHYNHFLSVHFSDIKYINNVM